jgi:C-terminal processing protease CtpA/Prc
LLGVSRTLKLSDGGKLNISDTDYRTAQGHRIEGLGVKPDQQIEVKIADLIAGRDRTLEAAVDSLGRAVAFGSRNTEMDFKLRLPDFSLRSSSQVQPAFHLQR